jgi:hypothetical protein
MFRVEFEELEGAEPYEIGWGKDRARNHPSDYGGSDVDIGDSHGYFNVGIVPTTGPEPHGTGRIVTFPNWIQVRIMTEQPVRR